MSFDKIYKLKDFKYHNKFKSLSVSSELFGGAVFPAKIDVVSNFTGEIIRFVPDKQMNEDAEWSDGHQMFYKPTVALKNVKYLVVYHSR